MSAISEGWIGTRRSDLVFFFGAALFSVLLALLFVVSPALVVPAWWLWLWLGDGPHIIATYTRTYLDPAQRAQHARLFAVSFLWFVPGVIAWAATLFGVRDLFDLYLLFALLWSTHHAARQNYGIMSIYHRYAKGRERGTGNREQDGSRKTEGGGERGRSGSDSVPQNQSAAVAASVLVRSGGTGNGERDGEGQGNALQALRALDTKFLYVVLWGVTVVFWLTHPMGRTALLLPLVFPSWAEGVLLLAKLSLLIAGVLYTIQTLQRFRTGRAPWPALFLVCQLGALSFAYFVLGRYEPLYPNARDPEQFFLAITVTGGLLHSAQYLAIVFAANQRRHQHGDSRLARLARAPRKMYLLFVGGALLYLLLLASRGNSPGINFFSLNSSPGKLFLALYWGVFFHHYYLDQYIWRPHKDPELREELGLSIIQSPGSRALS